MRKKIILNNRTSFDNTLNGVGAVYSPEKISRKKEIPQRDKNPNQPTTLMNANSSHFKSDMAIDAGPAKPKCKVTNSLFKQSDKEFVFRSSVQKVVTANDGHNPIVPGQAEIPKKTRVVEAKPTEYLQKHNGYLAGYMNEAPNKKREYIS